MLDISSENNFSNGSFRLAVINITADKFKFPAALNPLSNALERGYILKKRVGLGVVEGELDDQLLSRTQVSLKVITLEVLSIFLYREGMNRLNTYPWNEFICSRLFKLVIEQFAAANHETSELSLLLFILLIVPISLHVFFSGEFKHDSLSRWNQAAAQDFQGVLILSAEFLYGFPLEWLMFSHKDLSLITPAPQKYTLRLDLVRYIHKQDVEIVVREVIWLEYDLYRVFTACFDSSRRRDQCER